MGPGCVAVVWCNGSLAVAPLCHVVQWQRWLSYCAHISGVCMGGVIGHCAARSALVASIIIASGSGSARAWRLCRCEVPKAAWGVEWSAVE